MDSNKFYSTQKIIKEIKEGKICIIVDSKGDETESGVIWKKKYGKTFQIGCLKMN
jgi:3,4-dihydroxy-2-butanone 4-phosphate synthase